MGFEGPKQRRAWILHNLTASQVTETGKAYMRIKYAEEMKHFWESRYGDFGYMLVEFNSKTIHLSNMNVDDYPAKSLKRTSSGDINQFVKDAVDVFGMGSPHLRNIIGIGTLILLGYYDNKNMPE